MNFLYSYTVINPKYSDKIKVMDTISMAKLIENNKDFNASVLKMTGSSEQILQQVIYETCNALAHSESFSEENEVSRKEKLEKRFKELIDSVK